MQTDKLIAAAIVGCSLFVVGYITYLSHRSNQPGAPGWYNLSYITIEKRDSAFVLVPHALEVFGDTTLLRKYRNFLLTQQGRMIDSARASGRGLHIWQDGMNAEPVGRINLWENGK